MLLSKRLRLGQQMKFNRFKRREFITLLAGTAMTWPRTLAAQGIGARRIGVLMELAADEPQADQMSRPCTGGVGGAAGYIIPDFEKGLAEFAEDVLSISPTNYDLAPGLTDQFRKRFGSFMVHEAIESAVTLDVLA
jgi:hypothetical protein